MKETQDHQHISRIMDFSASLRGHPQCLAIGIGVFKYRPQASPSTLACINREVLEAKFSSITRLVLVLQAMIFARYA